MKTYTLIFCVIAICAIQATLAAYSTKCHKTCFEGCDFGVCKKTLSCAGCSRKFFEDKEENKEKIKLLKAKDDEKIQELKETFKEEIRVLVEKQTSELVILRKSHSENYETLVNNLDVELKALIASQKLKLVALKKAQDEEIEALKERHNNEIETLKQEHEERINKTRVVLKSTTDKKIKELDTICHGIDCPCCSTSGFTLNCSKSC
jgi:hypothetical protein